MRDEPENSIKATALGEDLGLDFLQDILLGVGGGNNLLDSATMNIDSSHQLRETEVKHVPNLHRIDYETT